MLLQLKADVQFFTRSSADRGAADIVGLGCSLANLGYEIKVRYAEGGGANCFKNLCHEFILVKVSPVTSTSSVPNVFPYSAHPGTVMQPTVVNRY